MIYYVGYYDRLRDGQFVRNVSPAAVRKMDYIIDVLCELGEKVTIVSPAILTSLNDSADLHPSVEILKEHCTLICPPMLPIKNKRLQAINARFARLWLKRYLLRHVKKDDVVMLYHVPILASAIISSLDKIGYKFILEIEEVYSKVWNLSNGDRKKEALLISRCNGNAIVVSEVLKERLGLNKALVSYGSYQTYSGPIRKKKSNTIRLVFSGGIEKTRGGAFVALNVIRKLPRNYTLTISGNIDLNSREEFLQIIQDINTEKGFLCVQYVGLLPQDQFEEMLLNSDIALNLQREGEYGGFLFPSKILTYLAYELPVVTTPGDSICKSSLCDDLFITEDYQTETIIRTITTIDLSENHDYRSKLQIMDKEFKKMLGELLK